LHVAGAGQAGGRHRGYTWPAPGRWAAGTAVIRGRRRADGRPAPPLCS